ncbi:MAG: hypothetical protein AWT59_3226 [Candidatus Gallionella acididurans]|uniref:Uncharacterized protein n=1 Tax=Candidatus Gallionella acididurans TaxID=1796491 RepID=A0A139BNR6_9PROT|nr:MAG: hypothetical protein AWT59_3226 [Candidatus Gallionella acididurans]
MPLSNQKTVAKWLVIANRLSRQAGKSLVIAMTALLDCRVGFASAALRSQLKPCCNDEALWIPRILGIDVPVF